MGELHPSSPKITSLGALIMKILSTVVLPLLIFTNICFSKTIEHDQWQEDLSSLYSHLESSHPNLYHSTDKQALSTAFNLAASEASLEYQYIELAKAMATIGDGHTTAPLLSLPIDMGIKFSYLPLQFRSFSDGIFVIAASKKYEHIIGSKLTAISSQPIESILPKIKRLISSDNNEWQSDIADYYLSNTQVINWATLEKSMHNPTLTLSNKHSEHIEVQISKQDYIGSKNWIDEPFIQPETKNWVNSAPQSPLFRCHENYCREYVKEDKTMYLSLRSLYEQKVSEKETFCS